MRELLIAWALNGDIVSELVDIERKRTEKKHNQRLSLLTGQRSSLLTGQRSSLLTADALLGHPCLPPSLA